MQVKQIAIAISLVSRLQPAMAAALVSSPGQTAAIPSWDLQSTAVVGTNLERLTRNGVNTSAWHHIRKSKCTLIGCLIEAGVYNETELFYSDNLRKVDGTQFLVPWIYRSEILLEPGQGRHFFLQTHGISSRADIFLNGEQVASRTEQAGSYVGRRYDITSIVGAGNALAIQVHPTDYYRDLALGWVDWNPWPADNGTGVWRDVEIKQTGSVVLEPLRVVTQLGTPIGSQPAMVTLKTRAQNLENSSVTITTTATIAPPSGAGAVTWNKTFTLQPLSTVDISLDGIVENPKIWWPRQWGEQRLYTANLTVVADDGELSDYAAATFGLRIITSKLNSYNDTTFIMNGQPFQVVGAGYTPNMFLRWDAAKWERELQYVLDLGFNTVRLEGKNEHPELYDIADRLGVMIMPGWECCDKWEAWSYNQDLAVPTPVWSSADYAIAGASMLHEAGMLQTHPSVLTYLIGSDYWTDERATRIYLDAFNATDWQTPVIGSASKRGYSPFTGPSGMEMEGPYDWVPPNYWYTLPAQLGAAGGFGSELGAGVGTPELASLQKFLSPTDLADLWMTPDKPLFHMSRETSSFETRAIYNAALWARWGPPSSLDDYLAKSQLMDYEATRAQFEAYAAMWTATPRPATGLIYWMLNNAWPSLHWNIWDYYMRPAGSYFGAKVGSRVEHVAYDYVGKGVYLINRSLDKQGKRTVEVQVLGVDGRVVHEQTVEADAEPNASQKIAELGEVLGEAAEEVVFLRLVLKGEGGKVLSRNVYWVSREVDVLDWESSEWYVTPVTKYANYTALNNLEPANLTVSAVHDSDSSVAVTLENGSGVPAFFVSLNLVDAEGRDVLPLTWEDNYVTLWPREKLTLTARAIGNEDWSPATVQVVGKNVQRRNIGLR
ncbi:glycoside hydrolase family 2 protein [Canariomyces notabilis]|uniref:Glycoside hydrolase family 2 protein n=1 Tax=Canariomyces notabilis TaxID=2074819 RepID=A0AAN6T8K7_9PEZI|nr:glycoside hydrolase family 2 protein [Canariomyces arenarius]